MRFNGETLVKKIEFKVFSSDHRTAEVVLFRNPDGALFTPDGVEKIKSDYMTSIQMAFPGAVFRCVKVGTGKYNVVHELGHA